MNDSTRIDVAALVLRVSLGVMFVAHALLKYFVFTPAGTVTALPAAELLIGFRLR